MKFKIWLELNEEDVDKKDLKQDLIQYLGMVYNISEVEVEKVEEDE